MSPDQSQSSLNEPSDPLDVFLRRARSELFAFIYEEEGAKGLRQLLAGALDSTPPDLSREQLQEEIADLRRHRLPKPAGIVAEFVDRFPSELDPAVFCAYPADQPLNVQAWLRRKRREIEQRRKARGLVLA